MQASRDLTSPAAARLRSSTATTTCSLLDHVTYMHAWQVIYCHNHGVVHRDIKLDNFIYENEYAARPRPSTARGTTHARDPVREGPRARGAPRSARRVRA